jgi:hypothetical protein
MNFFQKFGGATGSLMLLSGICYADMVNINLTVSLLSGSSGSAVTFDGTLLNTTGSIVFLNSAGINLAGAFTPPDEDTGPFFADAPVSLAAGASTSVIDLFSIDIPGPFMPGQYPDTFTILGGADVNAQDILGSTEFTVQVSGSTVPEPGFRSLLIVVCLMRCGSRIFPRAPSLCRRLS